MKNYHTHNEYSARTSFSARESRHLRFAGASVEGPSNSESEQPKNDAGATEQLRINGKTAGALTLSVNSESGKRVESGRRGSDHRHQQVIAILKQQLASLNPQERQEAIDSFNLEHQEEGIILHESPSGELRIDARDAPQQSQETQVNRAQEQPKTREMLWGEFGNALAQANPDLMRQYAVIQQALQNHLTSGVALSPEQTQHMISVHQQTVGILNQQFGGKTVEGARPRNINETLQFVNTILQGGREPAVNISQENRQTNNATLDTDVSTAAPPVGTLDIGTQQDLEEPIAIPVRKNKQNPEENKREGEEDKEVAKETVKREEDEEVKQNEEGPSEEEIKQYNAKREKIKDFTTQIQISINGAKTDSDLAIAEEKIATLAAFCIECEIPAPAIEAMTQTLNVAIEVQRSLMVQADAAFDEAWEHINMLIEGKQKNVNATKQQMYEMGYLTRAASMASGAWKAMKKSMATDQASLDRALHAQETMTKIGTKATPAAERIKAIGACMKEALQNPGYMTVNADLHAADERLTAADAVIRGAAEWLPGGSLGVAIADARIHPDDPDNLRKITGAVASTALDLVPVPGAKLAAKTAAKGVKMAATVAAKSVEKKVVKQMLVKGGKATARFAEKRMLSAIKDTAKEVTNSGLDASLGTTADSEVAPDPNAPKATFTSKVTGLVASEVIGAVPIPILGGKGKGKLKSSVAQKITAAIKPQVEKTARAKASEAATNMATNMLGTTEEPGSSSDGSTVALEIDANTNPPA